MHGAVNTGGVLELGLWSLWRVWPYETQGQHQALKAVEEEEEED